MADTNDKKSEQTNRDGATGYQIDAKDSTVNVGTHYHGPEVREAKVVAFALYLQSIRKDEDYLELDDAYTITTVEGRKTSPGNKTPEKKFSRRLKLRAEIVKPPKDELGDRDAAHKPREQVEQWDVLAGLRNYAAEHVLLIGKPGSGKSTSLERLLWEEAGRALQEPGAQVPVLVKLRRCTSTIENLIQDAFSGHGLSLDLGEVEQLLGQGRLLVLLDGLNELPDEFRMVVANFRDRYRKTTPMVVSTRDLAVGRTLGIDKTLKMLPLTEPQMREFVRGYLGEEGKRLFQQVKGDRLRKFAETPLLLWMLCRVFARSGRVPSNLGLAFREFTQLTYPDIQQDAPVKSRDQWPKLLQHLAFALMHDERSVVKFRLSMPLEEAEDVLTSCLQKEGRSDARNCAERWLQDLLSYHLLQKVIQPNLEEHVEFRHQLIQEYYAAEYLLRLLPELSDEELKRDYLNLLKWTESIALMLALVGEKDQALRIVKLAANEIDLTLSAKLVGKVREPYQDEAIDILNQEIVNKNVIDLLTVELLGKTCSKKINSFLFKYLKHSDIEIVRKATFFIGQIDNKDVIEIIVNRWKAVDSQFLKQQQLFIGGPDRTGDTWTACIEALAFLSPQTAIQILRERVLGRKKFDSAIHMVTQGPQLLMYLDGDAILPELIEDLEALQLEEAQEYDPKKLNEPAEIERTVRCQSPNDWYKSIKLNLIGYAKDYDSIVPNLIKLMEREKSIKIKSRMIGLVGSSSLPRVNQVLVKLLAHDRAEIWEEAVLQLAKREVHELGELQDLLNHSNREIAWRAAIVLGNSGSIASISKLAEVMQTSELAYMRVRYHAAKALANLDESIASPILLEYLQTDFDCAPYQIYVRKEAASSLSEIGCKEVIPALLSNLYSGGRQDHHETIRGLARLGVKEPLWEIVTHENVGWQTAAVELGKSGETSILPYLCGALIESDMEPIPNITRLFNSISDADTLDWLLDALEKPEQHTGSLYFRNRVALAIVEFPKKYLEGKLPALANLIRRENIEQLLWIVPSIQEKCGFYNYEIFHNLSPSGNPIPLYIASISIDRPLQLQLTNHLTPLQHQNLITISSQDQILGGSDRAQTIRQQLHTADIILLLISPNALADDTCYQQEILPAIQRHQTGQARTIPILLRPTDYTGEPFSHLDILPKNHRPITTWNNQDEAFREIAESVRTVALEIRRKAGEI